jgi:predicted GNAT family acetyltransferase
MTPASDISIERQGDIGRYVIQLPDGEEAEMTFRFIDGVMAIDHTGVPPHHRNQGLALLLIERAVADARAEGFRIHPACSYAEAQFRRHPQWTDLRQG